MLFFPYIRICQVSLISDWVVELVVCWMVLTLSFFFLLFHLLIKTACKQVAHVIFCNGRMDKTKTMSPPQEQRYLII